MKEFTLTIDRQQAEVIARALNQLDNAGTELEVVAIALALRNLLERAAKLMRDRG